KAGSAVGVKVTWERAPAAASIRAAHALSQRCLIFIGKSVQFSPDSTPRLSKSFTRTQNISGKNCWRRSFNRRHHEPLHEAGRRSIADEIEFAPACQKHGRSGQLEGVLRYLSRLDLCLRAKGGADCRGGRRSRAGDV